MKNTTMASLGVDAHCAMLTDHIRDKNAQMMDGFKHFVQLYAAILGGSVAIRLQYGADQTASYANSANLLVSLVALVSCLVVFENYRSWTAFRRKLSVVAGDDVNGKAIVPMPKSRAGWVHIALFTTMIIATVAFWILNPLYPGRYEGTREGRENVGSEAPLKARENAEEGMRNSGDSMVIY